MTRQYEARKLMEAEGLDRLAKALAGTDLIFERFCEEYAEYLDEGLVMLIECLRYDINVTLNGVVKLPDRKIYGVYMQLEDVMDEVQTLQAGLDTKHGVEGEDCDEDCEENE